MEKRNRIDISEAETMRYAKIQNLIRLLQDEGNHSEGINIVLENELPSSFAMGKMIAVDGEKIRIGKKSYSSHEIKKVIINTEGSMAIYGEDGKKLCGSLRLNVSLDNIELFCVWVRKSNIPVEVVSEKRERFFQYMFLFIVVITVALLKIIS